MTQLLIGSYSDGKPDGVRLVDFDPATGNLSVAAVLGGAPDASFFAYDSATRRLYLTDEMAEKAGGFTLAADARSLAPLGYQPSEGKYPCYVSLSPDRKRLAVANYGNDVVAVFSLDANGALQPNRQLLHGTQPTDTGHAHWVQWSPKGDRLYAVDLGHDEVRTWSYDAAKGAFGPVTTAFAPPRHTGPRHLAFHPNGKFAYLLTEHGNTLTALRHEPDGRLTAINTLPSQPTDYAAKAQAAHIQLSPDGTTVYVSNRGPQTIGVFRIAADGSISLLQQAPTGGDWPRFFLLLGNHLIVANQESNSLVVFDVAADGTLKATGKILSIPKPVAILAL